MRLLNQRAARTRRALLALVAGFALVLGLSTPAQAHSSDDWYVISAFSGLANHRYANPVRSGVEGQVRINWSGYDAEVQGYAEDTAQDGWCAVTQIRYTIYYNGSWHWHYRVPAWDCTHGNNGVFDNIQASRYSVYNIHARACLGYTNGTPYTPSCTDWT